MKINYQIHQNVLKKWNFIKPVQLCIWINNQCIDYNYQPQLNQDNCYLYTGGTYQWINNTCNICHQQKPRLLTEQTSIDLKESFVYSKITNIIRSSTEQYNFTLSSTNTDTTNSNCTYHTIISEKCYSQHCSIAVQDAKVNIRDYIFDSVSTDKWYELINCLTQTETKFDSQNSSTFNSTSKKICQTQSSVASFSGGSLVTRRTYRQITTQLTECFNNLFYNCTQNTTYIRNATLNDTVTDVNLNISYFCSYSESFSYSEPKNTTLTTKDCASFTNGAPLSRRDVISNNNYTITGEGEDIIYNESDNYNGTNVYRKCNTTVRGQQQIINKTDTFSNITKQNVNIQNCVQITNSELQKSQPYITKTNENITLESRITK